MSHRPRSVELSRQPTPGRSRIDRTLLRIRAAPGGDLLFGLFWRLPAGSRLRLRWLALLVVRTIEALNRKDYEVFTAHMAPDVEYAPPRSGGVPAWSGMDDVYVGIAGVRRFHEEWDNEWSEISHEPCALYDLGDRFVALYRMHGVGPASGIDLVQDYGVVADIGPGARLRRARFFLDWDEVLREAGIAAE